MSIGPISGGLPVTPPAATSPTAPTAPTAPSGATAGSPDSSFDQAIGSALDGLGSTIDNADAQAQGVATGTGNLADYMLAANQANLQTGLTVAIRDKAVEAFNQIMGMQF